MEITIREKQEEHRVILFFPKAPLFKKNIVFVCLHAPHLSLHLPKGMYSNFAPLSESDTDYFIVCVFLGAGLG